MDQSKPKSLRLIEERMQALEEGSLRHHVLESARNFKSSWIELGRSLYTVWKDKSFKEWGFSTFDAYSAKEIGIRKDTAMKLLRSYYFLEKEEPHLLKHAAEGQAEGDGAAAPREVPSLESVDVLRRAKSKKLLDAGDYAHLKKEMFEKGRDAKEVRKDLTSMIRQRQELEPEEAWEKRKVSTVRRLIGVLKSLAHEATQEKLLPAPLLKDAAELVRKLEEEIS